MQEASQILVTGGCGYIGSHTVLALAQAGYSVAIFDSLVNSHPKVIETLRRLSGQDIPLVVADIRDDLALSQLMSTHSFQAVMHFAGLKAVAESVVDPLGYYDVNVGGSLNLLRQMDRHGIRHMIFSSSATVYGASDILPISEQVACKPANPYGRSKWLVETILADWVAAQFQLKTKTTAMALRYFNPAGAHPSGELGEDPSDIPNNLLPYVSQVAIGRRKALQVFGDDYPTPDGTGVRDYIHVMDLAAGHVRALEFGMKTAGFHAINLGTGKGASVLDVVKAFEMASNRSIPYVLQPRRAGDVASNWADPALAHQLLGWKATRTLSDMCQDAWRWQSQHPLGYADTGATDTGHAADSEHA